MLNIAVFGATVSYVLMMLSHIVLRSREPDLERPYRTPGGTATTGVALVLALLAVVATFLVDTKAALITLGVYAAAALYFALYSRHHLVAVGARGGVRGDQTAEAELEGSERSTSSAGPSTTARSTPSCSASPTCRAASRASASWPALPRGGGLPRCGGVQLPAGRRRRHEHGRRATRCPRGRRGYGDFEMKPDFDTLRLVPWHEGTAMCMADLQWHGD